MQEELLLVKDNKIIIIGLDGVPFELLRDLSDREVMPNTKKILNQGILKKMTSSIPDVSSVAWSSIITGKNSAQHGIFGFTDLQPHTYRLYFPNFSNLQSSPFWDKLSRKSVIMNVPSTYPVKPMNGVCISGFVSIDFEKSVYPVSLVPKLKELEYRLDVNSELAHTSLELFLEDMDKTLQARIQAYRYLWESQDWQVFMFVFTETDRLMHFLWNAYEESSHKHHKDFLDHFHKIDETIGEINARINEKDLFILLSDHGFERLNKDIYINSILKKYGFLKFNQPVKLENVDYTTKAFALDPARIYINSRNKYPQGSVDANDEEKLLKDLEDLFDSIEIDNNKVIKRIYRKEEIYSGQLMDIAPDLVLVGNQGFNLKAKIDVDTLFDRGIFTGQHKQENACLFIKEPYVSYIPEEPSVFDVFDIIIRCK